MPHRRHQSGPRDIDGARPKAVIHLECTRLGGQFSYHLMDNLPGEVLSEIDWTAIAKGGMEPLGIVDIVDEAR